MRPNRTSETSRQAGRLRALCRRCGPAYEGAPNYEPLPDEGNDETEINGKGLEVGGESGEKSG